jgi:hypothetical protein
MPQSKQDIQDRPSRITRGPAPKGRLTERNYRKRASPALRRDFVERCAYSQRHTLQAGLQCMEVDHFNPELTGQPRHLYRNLMWSTRICNNAKRDYWPSSAEQKKGARFLNPCEEWDYGVHIFENPVTHELIGKTAAGRYHIQMLRLNHETFVWERTVRAELLQHLNSPKLLQGPFEEIRGQIRALREKLDVLIPPIPYELVLQPE